MRWKEVLCSADNKIEHNFNINAMFGGGFVKTKMTGEKYLNKSPGGKLVPEGTVTCEKIY